MRWIAIRATIFCTTKSPTRSELVAGITKLRSSRSIIEIDVGSKPRIEVACVWHDRSIFRYTGCRHESRNGTRVFLVDLHDRSEE